MSAIRSKALTGAEVDKVLPTVMKQIVTIVLAALLLAACGNKEKQDGQWLMSDFDGHKQDCMINANN